MTAKARAARVDLTLSKQGFDRGIAGARRELRGFARDGRKQLGDLSDYGKRSTFGRDMLGKLGRGAQIGGLKAAKYGLMGVGGAAAVGGVGLLSLADDVYNLERGLTRFQIATDMSDKSLADFRSGLSDVSRSTGVNRQELLDGAAAYVALTGDAEGATKGMELFGRVSNATGASMADIAATAAALKDNLGIDIGKEGEAAFSALAVQGKEGAVELRNLAAEMADLAPAMAGFKGGKGLAGLIETGAALQVVKKGAGTASKAATNLQQLSNAMIRNSHKFKAKGIRIFDKKGEKRNFLEIIDDVRKKGLSEPALINLLGSSEALSAMRELLARKQLIDDLIRSGSDKGAVARDAAKYEASDAGRIAKAWEAVKLKIAEAFTPERIEQFAGALEKVVMTVSRLIDGIEILKNWMDGDETRIGSSMGKALGAGAAATGQDFKMPHPIAFRGSGGHSLGGMINYANDAMEGMNMMRPPEPTRSPLGLGLGVGAALNIVLKVDGNEIARAQANANDQRTRPGGV